MDESASESREAISYSMKRAKVTKQEIQFQFNFTKPLEIVPTDKIKIQIQFNQLDGGIPEGSVVTKSMKRQIPLGGMPKLEKLADSATGITAAATVSSAIF